MGDARACVSINQEQGSDPRSSNSLVCRKAIMGINRHAHRASLLGSSKTMNNRIEPLGCTVCVLGHRHVAKFYGFFLPNNINVNLPMLNPSSDGILQSLAPRFHLCSFLDACREPSWMRPSLSRRNPSRVAEVFMPVDGE